MNLTYVKSCLGAGLCFAVGICLLIYTQTQALQTGIYDIISDVESTSDFKLGPIKNWVQSLHPRGGVEVFIIGQILYITFVNKYGHAVCQD